MNDRNSTKRNAAIVGGSLGGLFAANLLLRNGWDVDVFERVPDELSGRGAGIVTHPELFDVLRAAGVRIDASIGVNVEARITLARDGSLASERPLPQTLTAWSKMYHVLRAALPDQHYHAGAVVADVADGPDRASVTLADGSVVHADLVVAADGLRSAIRETFLPDARLQYAAMSRGAGWSTNASCPTRRTRRCSTSSHSGCRPANRSSATRLPGGTTARSPASALQLRLVSRDPRRHRLAEPADRRDRQAVGRRHSADADPARRARRDGRRRACAARAAVRGSRVRAAQPLFQPIYDLEVPHMTFGRIALLGDAAFVARPHCGMGVTEGGRRRDGARAGAGRPRRYARCAACLQRHAQRSAPRSSSMRVISARTCRRSCRTTPNAKWPSAIARPKS
jgi:2-polyprenyl-6-methoxyphenol hydroxylase-like FAD-dependent oxidoreductase